MPEVPTLSNDSLQTRRNSTVWLCSRSENTFVKKKYSSKFSVHQEIQAYRKMEIVTSMIDGVRMAEVIQYNKEVLTLEYVEGQNIMEAIANADIPSLQECRDRLVNAFIKAREEGVQFDSDPSNIIYNQETDEIVIVDPVCEKVEIQDHPMVVFAWGLIKGFMVYGVLTNFWSIKRIFTEYCELYISRADIKPGSISNQLSTYLNRVIKWNIYENEKEKWHVQVARVGVWVPTLVFIRVIVDLFYKKNNHGT